MFSNALIQLGDRVKFITDASYWVWEGKEIRIPLGTMGTIVPWNGTKACAIRIDGIQHPAFKDFPKAMTFPGQSLFPASMTLIGRQKIEEEEPLEPIPSWSAPPAKRRRNYAL